MDIEAAGELEHSSVVCQASETDPLLGGGGVHPTTRKPFYRARPLWLVPFAIIAAIVRGMTLAPRIEVFTQLSCANRYDHRQSLISLPIIKTVSRDIATSFYFPVDPLGPYPHYRSQTHSINLTFVTDASNINDIGEEDPRRLPSLPCLGDPAVQAGAARLQTIMTTTMGLLSALTTGWWGNFGERHGRTKVLAIATFGLFLTDLTFILVSTPSSPLSSHGHKLLILAPIIEGILGGWSTLQSATSAYLSDCTSSGSRAHIFSRFSGVFYFGFSIGPGIGGYLIRNPIWTRAEVDGVPTVTSVFWVAAFCSFVNFVLVLFVFPESLDKAKRQRGGMGGLAKDGGKGKGRAVDTSAIGECSNGIEREPAQDSVERDGIVHGFLKPLAIFLPAIVPHGRMQKRTDWSLTFLGVALLGSMLSSGVYQVKYLYAEHIYGWGAEQLSYYISFIGGARALFLLFLLPWIIATFKPKPEPNVNPSVADTSKAEPKNSKPTRVQLTQAISFDLSLTRFSLMVDILSNIFVALAPMPSFKIHALNGGSSHRSNQQSQAFFVLATTLSSLGSGAIPAIQSLALCVLQVRALDAEGYGKSIPGNKEQGVGGLFGALAVLQAVGQTILGPMLFGLIYSGTVATYPKAVFVTAAGILMCSLALVALVREPTTPKVDGPVIGKGKAKSKQARNRERGRSRVSKDLRGGAAGYGSMAGPS